MDSCMERLMWGQWDCCCVRIRRCVVVVVCAFWCLKVLLLAVMPFFFNIYFVCIHLSNIWIYAFHLLAFYCNFRFLYLFIFLNNLLFLMSSVCVSCSVFLCVCVCVCVCVSVCVCMCVYVSLSLSLSPSIYYGILLCWWKFCVWDHLYFTTEEIKIHLQRSRASSIYQSPDLEVKKKKKKRRKQTMNNKETTTTKSNAIAINSPTNLSCWLLSREERNVKVCVFMWVCMCAVSACMRKKGRESM